MHSYFNLFYKPNGESVGSFWVSLYFLYKVLYSSYTNGNKSFKIPTDSLLTGLILQNNPVQNQSRLLYWWQMIFPLVGTEDCTNNKEN